MIKQCIRIPGHILSSCRQTINADLSTAISILRLPLLILILYIHAWPLLESYTVANTAVSRLGVVAGLSWLLADLIGNHLARVAVPLMYIISAYLLFFNFQPTQKFYSELIGKRIQSLLIPFLCWNVLVWMFFSAGLYLEPTRAYFLPVASLVDVETVSEWLSMIFGYDRSPVAYQFWFIRDLMLLIMCSPFILLAMQRLNATLPLLMLGCWLLDMWPWFAPDVLSCSFFCIGAFLGWRRLDMRYLAGRTWLWISVYAFGLVVFSILQATQIELDSIGMNWIENQQLHSAMLTVFSKMLIVVGCCTLLSVAFHQAHQAKSKTSPAEHDPGSLSQEKTIDKQHSAAGAAFFIFAAHEPILTIIRKIAARIFSASIWIDLMMFLLLPLILSWCLYHMFVLLKRCAPTLCQVLTGDR
jgi:hypothetical protein